MGYCRGIEMARARLGSQIRPHSSMVGNGRRTEGEALMAQAVQTHVSMCARVHAAFAV